ncbi:MAG: CorA family divalent cation transporter [Hyphomicrobiales bacterium]|nr:CorA family divalent cation transporter [Hyphomicrobiales bacterium]
MTQESRFEGYLFGFGIDEKGRTQPLPSNISDGSKADGYWVWIGVDPAGKDTRSWLIKEAGLNERTCDVLLAMDTRPRCLVSPQGALLILRGVNAEPYSDPTDLASIRVWIEDDRIITIQHRKLATVDSLRAGYEKGAGPKSSAELIVALAEGMIDRLRLMIEGFQKEMDALEDVSLTAPIGALRKRLTKLRHDIVPLRRYVAPQRDAFTHLMAGNIAWMDDWWESYLREIADEVSRHIQVMDSLRESANIVQDTLNSRIAETTNKVIVILSVITAAFMPMHLFVGALGSNVSGIPQNENPNAFFWVIGILVAIGVVELWLFWRLGLMRYFR